MTIFNIEMEWVGNGQVIVSALFCRRVASGVEQGAVAVALEASQAETLTVGDLRQCLCIQADARSAQPVLN